VNDQQSGDLLQVLPSLPLPLVVVVTAVVEYAVLRLIGFRGVSANDAARIRRRDSSYLTRRRVQLHCARLSPKLKSTVERNWIIARSLATDRMMADVQDSRAVAILGSDGSDWNGTGNYSEYSFYTFEVRQILP
jgi:hypothetical protein